MYRLIEREVDIGLSGDVAKRHRVYTPLSEEQRSRIEHRAAHLVRSDGRLS